MSGVLVALRDGGARELLRAEREVECLRQVELGEQDRAEQIEQLTVEVLPSLASTGDREIDVVHVGERPFDFVAADGHVAAIRGRMHDRLAERFAELDSREVARPATPRAHLDQQRGEPFEVAREAGSKREPALHL